jgi:hypothetical protein
MTNAEAMKAFHEGKRIRMATWPAGQYIYSNVYGHVLTQDGHVTDVRLDLFTEHGFELYEEPGHDFSWAVDRLLEGKRVRRRGWHVGVSFYLNGGGWLICRSCRSCESECRADVMRSDFTATDWGIA